MPESRSESQDVTLPAGYRLTELGPLPEEWRVVRLGEVIEKTFSGVWGEDAPGRDRVKVRVVRVSDITPDFSISYSQTPYRFVATK